MHDVASIPLPQVAGPTSAQGAPSLLFRRWERQQWNASDYDFTQDSSLWRAMPALRRRELRHGIVQFFLGEISVTKTLAPIAHAAPNSEDQLFLCTQMADEARHTVFFQSYLNTVDPEEADQAAAIEGYWAEASNSQKELFDARLFQLTDEVRRNPDDRAAWYRGVTLYHLVLEGVLAVTGQKILIRVARALGSLPVLETGLTHVARDESRHVAFGVEALRRGVADGYADAIAEVVESSVEAVVWMLVHPERKASDILRVAATQRGPGPDMLWEAARMRLQKRLKLVGLDRLIIPLDRRWRTSRERALDAYVEQHGSQHPARTN